MLPFHVECSAESCLLYELNDGRFQIMAGAPTAPLIVGFQYVLANEELVSFFKSLNIPQVQYEAAIIWDSQQKKESAAHQRLRIGQHFEYDQIGDLDLDGHRLLVMDQEYLFVSPTLKSAINDAGFSFLRFSEGLSRFAG